MVLLDTHVWLWSASGDTRRIGGRARRFLSRAGSQNAVYVSPISLFELTALHTLGRLRLTSVPGEWIRDSLNAGIAIAELTPGIAIDAGHIPRSTLADPIDRILVATARHFGATLLTSDAPILAYGRAGNVRVQDAAI